MKNKTSVIAALVAFTVFAGSPAQADNMASIAITPATGAVTLTPRWSIGGNLAGFHQMAQDLGLTGSVANNFYSITNTVIPAGGNTLAFNFYVPGSGSATPHADIGSKLTPDSYSALTSADPDVGYGSVNLYLIHHKGTTDYFTAMIPGSATASAVTDEKPMSGPGGPGTVTGVSGYFGLTFAAANLGYGLNNFYYLRTDPVTSTTKFGTLAPALLASSADQFDLGMGGHNALAFTGTDVGYGTDKMYYLRLDPITGFTILGLLDPALAGVRHTSDIANLGSVYSTLTFVPGDVGFGSGQFYTTGAVNTTFQTVSFAAISDRAIISGPFNVNPTASSALPIVLTVVPGSVGAASIANVGGGVFTVTPTAPGLITLQATQVGQPAPAAPVYEYNMLRQSFTITGVATLAITTQPTPQTVVTASTATFSVAASGTSTLSYQWRKAGVNISGNASAATATLSLTNAQSADQASYDVAVTNASGTIYSNAVTLTVTVTGASPIITNSPLTAGGTVSSAFSFTITASGSPTSFSATPLPVGLAVNTSTGAITGTPTAAGSTSVTLGATNATGTGNATLTITVGAAATPAPVVSSALTASGTVGTAFTYTITASNSPTSFSASPLPAGITRTGATLSGTPTAAGSTSVTLGATNATGTGNATLTVTIAAAAPVVPPAILAVLPLITTPTTDWPNYQPAQIKVQPEPSLNVTFDMTYHQEGVYTVGFGRSVIPGESLVTIASTAGIDLIVSLMANGIEEHDIRIRGALVTTTLKTAIGLCGTEEQVAGSLPGSSPTTVAGTIVSVLFFYDESTAAAADQLSIDGYGIAVVENGNFVLQNSGVTNLSWRYAGALKVAGYTSDGNTQTDLTAMSNILTTVGAIVAAKGNELSADQSVFIFNVFQTGGISGRAERPGHNSTVYWQAPWYVYVHELGHNFGAHHDRAFDNVADSNGQFSYGFAWTKPLDVTTAGGTSTIQVGYGTMMSYWGLEFIQPYLSNTSVSLTYVGNFGTSQQFIETRAIGVAAGQPKAADNARTLSEAGLAMAGYRVVAGNPPPPVTPIVTPPVTPPAKSSGGGGAPSIWFLVALTGLAALRRKFAKQ